MNLSLRDALETQTHLLQRRLTGQGKSLSPDLQAVFQRFPELQKLWGQVAPEMGKPTGIAASPDNQILAFQIIHAKVLPPARSAFPDAERVTLLILRNGTTFYFLKELFSHVHDLNNELQGAYLLTPEATLLNRLPSSQSCEGPHLIVAEGAWAWAMENFEVLREARYCAVQSWNEALAALEKGIQETNSDRRLELYHTSVRQLLAHFPCLIKTEAENYLFRGQADLDKCLVDCIPARRQSPPEEPVRRVDFDRAVIWYHKASKAPVFLKKLHLPAHLEARLRQRMRDTKDTLEQCRLTRGRFPGFSEITEVVQLAAQKHLLLDENGFSTLWNAATQISADIIKADYCVPAAQMQFPPQIWSTSYHLLPKAEVQALMDVTPEEDPFCLAPGFLAYLRNGTQACGEKESTDRVWFANLCAYLERRLSPSHSPRRDEIMALAPTGRPPYRVGDVLRHTRQEQAGYYGLTPERHPFGLLQPGATCAETIRKLYRNQPFLEWRLEPDATKNR